MNKPKKQQKENSGERQERDFFQTPNYATDLLKPYIPAGTIWSPASGDGKIGKRFTDRKIFETDIVTGFNFLTDTPDFQFDVIVENPPFSLKRKFYDKCMSYDVPFALLLPVDFCGWILRAMKDDGIEWLIPTRRIDYITPTGKSGSTSSAQYHSGWLTHKFQLPKQITVVELTNEQKQDI